MSVPRKIETFSVDGMIEVICETDEWSPAWGCLHNVRHADWSGKMIRHGSSSRFTYVTSTAEYVWHYYELVEL